MVDAIRPCDSVSSSGSPSLDESASGPRLVGGVGSGSSRVPDSVYQFLIASVPECPSSECGSEAYSMYLSALTEFHRSSFLLVTNLVAESASAPASVRRSESLSSGAVSAVSGVPASTISKASSSRSNARSRKRAEAYRRAGLVSKKLPPGLCYAKLVVADARKSLCEQLALWPTVRTLFALKADLFSSVILCDSLRLIESGSEFHVAHRSELDGKEVRSWSVTSSLVSLARRSECQFGTYGDLLRSDVRVLGDDVCSSLTLDSRLGGSEGSSASAARYVASDGVWRCSNCHYKWALCMGEESCASRARARLDAIESTGVEPTRDGLCYTLLFRPEVVSKVRSALSAAGAEFNPRVSVLRTVVFGLPEFSFDWYSKSRVQAVTTTCFVDGHARNVYHIQPGSCFARTVLESMSKGWLVGGGFADGSTCVPLGFTKSAFGVNGGDLSVCFDFSTLISRSLQGDYVHLGFWYKFDGPYARLRFPFDFHSFGSSVVSTPFGCSLNGVELSEMVPMTESMDLVSVAGGELGVFRLGVRVKRAVLSAALVGRGLLTSAVLSDGSLAAPALLPGPSQPSVDQYWWALLDWLVAAGEPVTPRGAEVSRRLGRGPVWVPSESGLA